MARVGGVSAGPTERRCCRGGRAVHRGIREGSEEQSLQGLEPDVLGKLFPAPGAGRGDPEAARRRDARPRSAYCG